MDIKRPYLLYFVVVIIALAATISYYLAGERSETIESIAVLPFLDTSERPEQEYFAAGLTEAIINELSLIRALRVISHASIMRYKNTDSPLSSIARELDVDALVTGTVHRVGERIRIRLELVEPDPERHLWTNAYECGLDEILSVQEEVARDIAREIKIALTPEEEARLSVAGPVDPAAHEAYLQGRFYINQWSKASVEKALEYFERAIELDPRNAPAYAGLAKAYDILASFDWISTDIGWPKARSAALKALEIDRNVDEAQIVLADVKFMYDWDWNAAERDFKLAIGLNPGSAEAHTFYAGFLTSMGRFDEAYAEVLLAEEYDPHSFGVKRLEMIYYSFSKQYGRARRQIQELLEIDPDYYEANYMLGWISKEIAHYDTAVEQFHRALGLAGGSPADSLRAVAGLARTYALAGDTARARTHLADLLEKTERAYITPYIVAKVYALLGEADRAFEWLEKAYLDRSPYLTTILIDPELDSIRTDPRFSAFLKKMGLTPYRGTPVVRAEVRNTPNFIAARIRTVLSRTAPRNTPAG